MTPDLESLLPPDHDARAVWLHVQRLDLSALFKAVRARGSRAGRPEIDPALLMALWRLDAALGQLAEVEKTRRRPSKSSALTSATEAATPGQRQGRAPAHGGRRRGQPRPPSRPCARGQWARKARCHRGAGGPRRPAPVQKPRDAAQGPFQPLPGDGPGVACWRQPMGTDEARRTQVLRAAVAECIDAQAGNRLDNRSPGSAGNRCAGRLRGEPGRSVAAAQLPESPTVPLPVKPQRLAHSLGQSASLSCWQLIWLTPSTQAWAALRS